MKTDDWVLHRPTSTIDQVKEIWSGDYVNPQGQRIEDKIVVELASGDAFIDTGEEFAILTGDELGFVLAARRVIERVRAILVSQAATIPLQEARIDVFLTSEFHRIARRKV